MREIGEGKREVTFLIECFFSSKQSRAEYNRVSWCQHTHVHARTFLCPLANLPSFFTLALSKKKGERFKGGGEERGRTGGDERGGEGQKKKRKEGKSGERRREKTSLQSLSPFLERARAPAAPPV